MRSARVSRVTKETQIELELDLDGSGRYDGDVPVPFLGHMLDQIARHGMIDLTVKARGDVEIDDHHTVEDVGIAFGRALGQALGDKSGIRRYGCAHVPLDEALSRVVIDFSGRPGLFFSCDFHTEKIGSFDTELVREFFQGAANAAAMTLHVDNLKGANSHHQAETMFKAFGRALRQAVEIDPRLNGAAPSTKGTLSC